MIPGADLAVAQLLAYLVNIIAGLTTDAILESKRKDLREKLEQQSKRLNAINNRQSLRDQLSQIGLRVAEIMAELGIDTPAERALFGLVSDPIFRDDLTEWLVSWDLQDVEAVKKRLEVQIASVLRSNGATDEQIGKLRTEFFDAVDNYVFSDTKISHWRLQLAISETIKIVNQHRLEHAGEYSSKRIEDAEREYRVRMLKEFDVVDLLGLPSGDTQTALETRLLRDLYIPLRASVENARPSEKEADNVKYLGEIENRREQLRAGGNLDEPNSNRQAIGELLKLHRRVVVLGDPGSGKTTMTKWFAITYLSRLAEQLEGVAHTEFPDLATLPEGNYYPVLIRCRDLRPNPELCGFHDLLQDMLGFYDFSQDTRNVLLASFRRRLETGTLFVMIDGLDELSDPALRAKFCRKLEWLARNYPKSPIIVTSRIVGYREMPFRLSNAFLHSALLDLLPGEMDDFAERWARETHLPAKGERSLEELKRNIHSSDRVERLARNPMLLTTLALVQRKVGQLPQRRVHLYREALELLLNWRGDIDTRLNWDEAVPQLEYVAYSMCQAGVKRLNREAILELIEEMRSRFGGRLRAVTQRKPEDFLHLLEQRSSLLIESGLERVDGREIPVFEFRHLTFQEYLAALALVNGRIPDYEKYKSFANRIYHVSSEIEEYQERYNMQRHAKTSMVREDWREPIRLALCSCRDDEVDDAIIALLQPENMDMPMSELQARSFMAALCLSDEPNLGEDIAYRILDALINSFTEDEDHELSHIAQVVIKSLEGSVWAGLLSKKMTEAIGNLKLNHEIRHLAAYTYSNIWVTTIDESKSNADALSSLQQKIITRINATGDDVYNSGALIIMMAAYRNLKMEYDDVIGPLTSGLVQSRSRQMCSIWALGWLAQNGFWQVQQETIHDVVAVAWNVDDGFLPPRFAWSVLEHCDPESVNVYVADFLEHPFKEIRSKAVEWSKAHAVSDLSTHTENYVHSNYRDVRNVSIQMLVGQNGLSNEDAKLLTSENEEHYEWIDPLIPVNQERVEKVAKRLKMTVADVRAFYEKYAPIFKLTLEWQKSDSVG
jgi:hypothetical protein